MSRRAVLLVILVAIAVTGAIAQEPNRALQAYQDRFETSTPEIKLQVLQTADLLPVEELGPLYVQAIQFVLTNANEIDSNIILRDMALFATEKIGEGGYAPATSSLWSLFVEYGDNTSRIAILEVLGAIGVGDAELIIDLNGWVQAQTNLYRGGVLPDQQVYRNAVLALGRLGDTSSFPVLLDVQLAQISDAISAEGRDAMAALPGDRVELASQAINARSLSNRLIALRYFLDDESLTDEQRAQIASAVLAEAVREVVRDPNQLEDQRQLRYRAAQQLIEVPAPEAVETLVRHFNLTFTDYDRGFTTRTWVLEAVAALGNTGTERAAERLTQFLDLLNTYTENDRPYDTQIMLAVIANLERLDNVLAYDALFYVTLLEYPQRVKEAAVQAINTVSQ